MRARALSYVYIAAIGACLALVGAPAVGHADDTPPTTTAPSSDATTLNPLLTRLAHHAAQFEDMKRRGSFTLSGKMEELDTSGHVDETKEMVVRVTATPVERVTEILKYFVDGTDKTAEARAKAAKRRAEKKSDTKLGSRDIHLPFLASEQAKYKFAMLEHDPTDASRVRIGFTPLEPAESSFKGSAWIDESKGEILTMGFSPSKNPTFVDHVDVTMRFDLTTPLGRAPSSLVFDARGGFLVIHKHYRGSATITDPHVGF